MSIISCEHCGAQISSRAKKCPSCGSYLVEDIDTVTCEECKSEITKDSAECPYCGCPQKKRAVKKDSAQFIIAKINGSVIKATELVLCSIFLLALIIIICIVLGVKTVEKKMSEIYANTTQSTEAQTPKINISEEEAEEIANKYWGKTGDQEDEQQGEDEFMEGDPGWPSGVNCNSTLVDPETGKTYYYFVLSWLVDAGTEYEHVSTVDFLYIDAETGECFSDPPFEIE